MATFTWKDVDDLLASEGLYMDDDERRKLANDPDTAYSIAKKKQLYKYAQTDDERSKIHSETESLRKGQGYSMGDSGATFSTVPSPSSFSSDYTADVKKNYEAARDYEDFKYDAFDDKHASKRAELLDAIANPTPFEYNKDNDPVYQSFAKQYRREGARAVEEALARASANTGGRASSAAVTAAAQAGNHYGAQLADKIPQLYDAAYDRWLDEFTMKQNALAAYQGETDADYDRYTSERSFAKGVHDDKYSRLIDAMNNAAALESVDYDRNKDNLTYSDNQKSQELKDAITLGTQVGDTSSLKGMGYDTTLLDAINKANKSEAYLNNQYLSAQLDKLKAEAETEKQKNDISMAEYKAALGDYTMLAELLGVDVEQVEAAYTAKDTPTDPTDDKTQMAQTIRAMLMMSAEEDFPSEDIPSLEEIKYLLASGYTGFNDMLIQSVPDYAARNGIPLTNPLLSYDGATSQSEKARITQQNEKIKADNDALTKAYFTDYAAITAAGQTITREEWELAKRAGNQYYIFLNYDSYDAFINDYNVYLSENGFIK